MTPLEAQTLQAQEQNLAIFSLWMDRLIWIADNGPDDSDDDRTLCRKMAKTIIGDLALSEYNSRAEGGL